MSYQFDPIQLRQTAPVTLTRDVSSVRLLARRSARQARRAQRAF
ncbi:hypothetical protein [Algimonas porphyrae]|nr:hypothetical protein [Algimonas porphyrae]